MVPSTSSASSLDVMARSLDDRDIQSEDCRRSQIKAEIGRHRAILKGLKLELHLLDSADLELYSAEASSAPLMSVFRSLSPSDFLMAYEIGRRLLVLGFFLVVGMLSCLSLFLHVCRLFARCAGYGALMFPALRWASLVLCSCLCSSQ